MDAVVRLPTTRWLGLCIGGAAGPVALPAPRAVAVCALPVLMHHSRQAFMFLFLLDFATPIAVIKAKSRTSFARDHGDLHYFGEHAMGGS